MQSRYNREYNFGWTFDYAQRQFFETGDATKYGIPGMGPLVVFRTGEVKALPARPDDRQIRELEDQF